MPLIVIAGILVVAGGGVFGAARAADDKQSRAAGASVRPAREPKEIMEQLTPGAKTRRRKAGRQAETIGAVSQAGGGARSPGVCRSEGGRGPERRRKKRRRGRALGAGGTQAAPGRSADAQSGWGAAARAGRPQARQEKFERQAGAVPAAGRAGAAAGGQQAIGGIAGTGQPIAQRAAGRTGRAAPRSADGQGRAAGAGRALPAVKKTAKMPAKSVSRRKIAICVSVYLGKSPRRRFFIFFSSSPML